MKKGLRNTLITLGLILAIAGGMSVGLYVPRLLAQEVPPVIGHGAVSRIEIIESTKCSATINLLMGSQSRTMSISLPPGQCNRMTGEEIAAEATQALQWGLPGQPGINFCQLLDDLPADDPDRTIDPARPSLHWVLRPEGMSLCSIPVIVTVIWDPITESYSISWRSSNAGYTAG